MGMDLVGLQWILLICISSSQATRWEFKRIRGLSHPILTIPRTSLPQTLGVNTISYLPKYVEIQEHVKNMPHYPFLIQDPSKVIPTLPKQLKHLNTKTISESGQTVQHDQTAITQQIQDEIHKHGVTPGIMDKVSSDASEAIFDMQIKNSYVIPMKLKLILYKLFNTNYRRYLLNMLNKYSINDLSGYGNLDLPYKLSDKQLELLKIMKLFAKQQAPSNAHYDITGNEGEHFKYLYELLAEFYKIYFGHRIEDGTLDFPEKEYTPQHYPNDFWVNKQYKYPIDLDNKKHDNQIHIKIWEINHQSSNYPLDFWLVMQKYPSIFARDSPEREKTLMNIINNFMGNLDTSNLVGNSEEQKQIPPELLSVLLKLHGVSRDQQYHILYNFLTKQQDTQILLRYIYTLYNLSNKQNTSNILFPHVTYAPAERDDMITKVIHNFLDNLNLSDLIRDPIEQQKYPPELLTVLFKVYASEDKKQQFSILYEFLNQQFDSNILFGYIYKLNELSWNPNNKWYKNLENSPENLENMITKEIYNFLSNLNIKHLIDSPIVQQNYPTELLTVLLKLYDFSNDQKQQYNILYDFLKKQNNTKVLLSYLYKLHELLYNQNMKPNGVVIMPQSSEDNINRVPENASTEINNNSSDHKNMIENVIYRFLLNPDILYLTGDPIVQRQYPLDLLTVLLRLYNASGNQRQQYNILYDFLSKQSNPNTLKIYINKLHELSVKLIHKWYQSLDNGSAERENTIRKVVYNFLGNLNISHVIDNAIEIQTYQPHLLSTIFKIYQNPGDQNQQYNTLYEFLNKQNNRTALIGYLYKLYALSWNQSIKLDGIFKIPEISELNIIKIPENTLPADDIIKKQSTLDSYGPADRENMIVKVINNFLETMNNSQLISNPLEHKNYTQEFLSVLLEVYQSRDQKQQFNVLYDFLNKQNNLDVLLEYLKKIYVLSYNQTKTPNHIVNSPEFWKEVNMTLENKENSETIRKYISHSSFDRQNIIIKAIKDFLNMINTSQKINLDQLLKYRPELLSILLKLYDSRDQKQQFNIMYDFLTKQNDLNVLSGYIHSLYDLAFNQIHKEDMIVDWPVLNKCSVGTKWRRGCDNCVCLEFGISVCQKIPGCGQRLPGDPMQCKPYSKFELDECNSCECNKDGVPVCTFSECTRSQNNNDKEINSDRPVLSDCPSGNALRRCAPGTLWHSNCHECTCNGDGKRQCLRVPGCKFTPLDKEINSDRPVLSDFPSGNALRRCAPGTLWHSNCHDCTCNGDGKRQCLRVPGCKFTSLGNPEKSPL